jgi:plastocyanin
LNHWRDYECEKLRGLPGLLLLLSGLLGVVLLSANRLSAAVANVSVRNNVFSPGSVTINTNDQVTWTWSAADGATPHSTTSDSPGLWDSGIHTQPLTFTMSFPGAGSFPYHCTVHASFGMVGTVKVQAAANVAPTITTQPANQTVSAGANVTFTVVATGTAPLTFQWRFNGTNITGETGSSLLLRNVQTNNLFVSGIWFARGCAIREW